MKESLLSARSCYFQKHSRSAHTLQITGHVTLNAFAPTGESDPDMYLHSKVENIMPQSRITHGLTHPCLTEVLVSGADLLQAA